MRLVPPKVWNMSKQVKRVVLEPEKVRSLKQKYDVPINDLLCLTLIHDQAMELVDLRPELAKKLRGKVGPVGGKVRARLERFGADLERILGGQGS